MKRTEWIDRAKGIGIILVVIGHSTQYLYTDKLAAAVTAVIYSFHMPLFFLLSGMYAESSLERRGTKEFLADKLRTIVYPYVVYSLFEGSYRYALGKTTGFTDFVGLHQIASFYYKPLYHYWFLYALAATFFIFAAAVAIFHRTGRPLAILSIVAVSVFMLSGLMPHNIARQLAETFIYFVAGAHFSRVIGLTKTPLGDPRADIAVALGTLFILGNVLYFSGLAPDAPRLIQSLGFSTIGIACTTVIAFALRDRSAASACLAYLGRLSMAIYIFHIPPMAIVKYLLDSHDIHGLLPHALIECSIGLAVPVLIARYVEPRLPNLYRWHAGASRQRHEQLKAS